MRKTALFAAAASVFAFGAAPTFADVGSVDGDSDTAVLNLFGTVDAECEIAWAEGGQSKDVHFEVDDTAEVNGGTDEYDAGTLEASCNSPYTVTMSSANGEMRHHSQSNLMFDYRINFAGDSTEEIQAEDAQAAPQEVASISTFDFLSDNGSDLELEVKINFFFSSASDTGFLAPEDRQLIAGEYTDTLTFEVVADPLV
ncbi:MAG: hypothetical protein ACFE0P_09360 [Oceanicaulis sp.]